MADIFLKLLNMSFTASFLIVAVLVLRLVLKKAPRQAICVLWGLVALRLICPFSIESVLSLIPSAEPIPMVENYYEEIPQIESGVGFIDNTVNPIISENLAPNIGESVNPLQVWLAVGSFVWVIGLLCMLLYAGISYFRVYRKVRISVRLEEKIYLCDEIDTPFIFGVIRPRIYLPSGMEENVSKYVIAHEKAHLKRLDHLWKPFGFLLLSVYWFHPLLWVAYVMLCRDIELACDERVIKDMGTEDKKAYSMALVSCSASRRMIAACPLAFGEVGVKARVKSVLNYRKPSFWILLVVVVAVAVVAVLFMTNPVDGQEDSKNQNETVEDTSQLAESEPIETADEVSEAEEDRTEQSNALLLDKYADSSQLETREGVGAEEFVFEDRRFICEETVQDELEYLIYNYYYFSSTGGYDKLFDLLGDNESLKIAVQNERDNFEEGIYMSEYCIHELETLPIDAVQTASDATKKYISNALEKYDLAEYAIVKADISWKHNVVSLAQGPQLGDGRYARYYLVAKGETESSFKIYEVFWEDFYSPDMQAQMTEELPTIEAVMDRILSAIPLEEATPLTTTADLPGGDQLYFLDTTEDGTYLEDGTFSEDGTYSLYGFHSDEYDYTGLLINYKINGQDNWNYITDIEHWIGYEFPRIAEAEDGGLFLTYCYGGGTGVHMDRFFYFKADETGTLERYELTVDSLMEQAEELVSFTMDKEKEVVQIFDREGGRKEHFASVPYEDALNGQEYTIKGIYCDSCQVKFILEPNMLILGYGFSVEESVMPVWIGELAFRIGVEQDGDEVKLVLSEVSTYERGGVIDLLPNAREIDSEDAAVALVTEQVITAYENAYGAYTPSDVEPTLYSEDSERLAYIIPRLAVREETDEYYVIPVIWDFRVYKNTGEVKVFYNGIDPMEYTFDPANPAHLAFAG